MSIKAKSSSLAFSYDCTNCGEQNIEVKLSENTMSQISVITLHRTFEDTDDGFIIEVYHSCPKCKKYNEVQIIRKNGWGM